MGAVAETEGARDRLGENDAQETGLCAPGRRLAIGPAQDEVAGRERFPRREQNGVADGLGVEWSRQAARLAFPGDLNLYVFVMTRRNAGTA